MESYLIDMKDKKTSEALLAFAKRLNLRARKVDTQAREDLALIKAIDEGRASGQVDEHTVMDTLRRAMDVSPAVT